MTLLERVDIDRIAIEANQVHFRRTALTLLVGLLYLIGWTAGTIVRVLWVAGAWSFASIKVGWQDAQRPREGMTVRRMSGPA